MIDSLFLVICLCFEISFIYTVSMRFYLQFQIGRSSIATRYLLDCVLYYFNCIARRQVGGSACIRRSTLGLKERGAPPTTSVLISPFCIDGSAQLFKQAFGWSVTWHRSGEARCGLKVVKVSTIIS